MQPLAYADTASPEESAASEADPEGDAKIEVPEAAANSHARQRRASSVLTCVMCHAMENAVSMRLSRRSAADKGAP